MSMRILVTGSRDWSDAERVFDALAEVIDGPDWTIVHGDCPTGADALADFWGRMTGYPLERHPAEWNRPDGSFDPAAGPRRNAKMVALGADFCLAFIGDCTSRRCTKPRPHPSHGASGAADLAEKAGIPTRRFTA